MAPSRALRLAGTLLAAAGVSWQLLPATPRAEAAPDFARDVLPFLEKHCLECHEGAEPEGDFDLSPYRDEAAAREAFDDWDYLRERVLDGEMPPRSRTPPGGAELDAFLGWIDATHGPIDLRFRPLDPGRPVLRRLNAREYRRTVQALCGVDFPAEEHFPADAVGFGFDHVGATLSLPDALFEKYLRAAERIADQAIVRWSAADAAPRRRSAEELSGGRARGDTRALVSRGTVEARFSIQHPGRYEVTVEAWGQQAGEEACRMGLEQDGRSVHRFEVPATREEPGVYSTEIELQPGSTRLGASFLNDYYVENVADRNLYIVAISLRGPLEPPQPTAFQAAWHARHADASAKERLPAMLRELMSRAWRRPVAEAEVKRLVRSLPTDLPLDHQLHQALVTLLVSPRFLFRYEADEAQLPAERAAAVRASFAGPRPLHAEARALDDWELASRLAYFLTSGPPDDALRARAAAGELTEAAVLRAEVDRLLAAPDAAAFIENFAGQWLQLRNLERLAVDTERYPDWDLALRQAMERETLLLFATVLHEDRDLRELLDADFTFVNERLAAHYGMDGVTGEELQRVPLTAGPRGGLLGQASILTLTSNPGRTSPVKRGKWILETLLGAPPPPPPPEADALDESSVTSAASLREELAEHRARPSCAVCHDAMDPLGLGLENFDPIGAWRSGDQGGAIDASGILPGGVSFSGPEELRSLLRDDPAFVRTVVEKLLIYALGRGLERSDRPTVQGILAGLDPERPTLRAILHGIVESAAFRLRRTAP